MCQDRCVGVQPPSPKHAALNPKPKILCVCVCVCQDSGTEHMLQLAALDVSDDSRDASLRESLDLPTPY
jgi:hypothetical protein